MNLFPEHVKIQGYEYPDNGEKNYSACGRITYSEILEGILIYEIHKHAG